MTCIRIGRNMLFFDEKGGFDGTEHAVVGLHPDSPEADAIKAAIELQGQYKGLAPDEAYFQPGSPGWQEETRAWPSAVREDPGRTYVAIPKKEDESN